MANTESVECFQNIEVNVWIKNILIGVLKLDSFEIHIKPRICIFICTKYLMHKIIYKASVIYFTNGSN